MAAHGLDRSASSFRGRCISTWRYPRTGTALCSDGRLHGLPRAFRRPLHSAHRRLWRPVCSRSVQHDADQHSLFCLRCSDHGTGRYASGKTDDAKRFHTSTRTSRRASTNCSSMQTAAPSLLLSPISSETAGRAYPLTNAEQMKGGKVTRRLPTSYRCSSDCSTSRTNHRRQTSWVENIEKHNYTLTTGFIGTPHLNLVLSDNGHDDVALQALPAKRIILPGSIRSAQGATTIWERWNSIRSSTASDRLDMNCSTTIPTVQSKNGWWLCRHPTRRTELATFYPRSLASAMDSASSKPTSTVRTDALKGLADEKVRSYEATVPQHNCHAPYPDIRRFEGEVLLLMAQRMRSSSLGRRQSHLPSPERERTRWPFSSQHEGAGFETCLLFYFRLRPYF